MIRIKKGTDCIIKIKVYDNEFEKNPINLSNFIDFNCAILENGAKLIEKKYSKNEVFISNDIYANYPYILNIIIKKSDTQNMSLNPIDEEKIRIFELYGIYADDTIKKIIDNESVYIEGSGFYV